MNNPFQQIADEFYQNHDFSGTCLVKKGDTVLFSCAHGFAHRGFQIPNRLDTKFDTASVTKLFTATAILLLVENGKLKLDARITDIINLEGTEIPSDVTIEHSLTHTSGIADDADEEAGENYSDLFVDKPNYSIRKTVDLLPQFVHKKPLFKAGTGVRYNNCAFVLLGLAIEKLAGTDYRTFVMENIVKPCGLNNTRFCAMDEVSENAVEGYTTCEDADGHLTGWKKNIYSYPPIGTPDRGIYSTVEDLDKFLRYLKAGNHLSKPYGTLLFQPHCLFTRPFTKWKPVPYATIRTGYGFKFVEFDQKIFCVRKDGMNDGVAAMLSYYPETDASIVILSNQDCNIWEMHRRMQTVLYTAYSI
ncbi:serine hydrolase domain-containing protein [Sporolactobacillus pectinivorans]|uniref:serine hydrolase domain-containing protein n=1 Tax=Sporolactobacillus pectinivorans TaxID=1591408 RepID=UPI000C256A16|nr:serine hydrolase domain-containing protein [Sporolactobacillus pectinivorans]